MTGLERYAADLALAERFALAARQAAAQGDHAQAAELRRRMDAIFDRIEQSLDTIGV